MLRNGGYVFVPAGTVRRYKIGANAARDEHMLHSGDSAKLPQQFKLRTVVRPKRRACTGEKAALVPASSILCLSRTVESVHVRSRTADIRNSATEHRMAQKPLHLIGHALFRTAYDAPSLMDGDCAESAFPIAAAVRGDAKPDCVERSYFSLRTY